MIDTSEKYIINGGAKLHGSVRPSGAKNVALKTLVAACLTDEPVVIHNIPLISDFFIMVEIIEELGGTVTITDHTARVQVKSLQKNMITLDQAAHIRTSSMFLAPLLARNKQAIIPNPGGCRLGARPIDRLVEGLQKMGAQITYLSDDGYFHAQTNGLIGTEYIFKKNTHTGTEIMLIAASVAKGKTILRNAAAEPEIDELIDLLNKMGAQIKRTAEREIEINGVEKLHGTEFTIASDRNEIVTFAIAAIASCGDVLVEDAKEEGLKEFLAALEEAGGGFEIKENGIRFYYKETLKPVDVTTSPYPGFMTDWQAPWAILMTQANGKSTIHETVFENKLGYVNDLRKMGAKIELFNPNVSDREKVYNFNLTDDRPEYFHAIRVTGATPLHNAIVTMVDLRAGAAMVIAALIAKGETTIHGLRLIKRGYEDFDERLRRIGATIQIVSEE